MKHQTCIVPLLFLVVATVVSKPAWSAACSATSPTVQPPLVELFTSEGCSSCPPADKWLSSLRNTAPDAPRPIILSLHVDYWNDLGWTDPWSQHGFTLRQQHYADLAASRGVYTPQVFVSGRELRDWPRRSGTSALPPVVDSDVAPTLKLQVLNDQPHLMRLRVDLAGQGRNPRSRTAVVIAKTVDGLESQVGAGENRNRLLQHDGVVIDWVKIALQDRQNSVETDLPLQRRPGGVNAQLVAFLQDEDSGRILRAVTLPLDNCHL